MMAILSRSWLCLCYIEGMTPVSNLGEYGASFGTSSRDSEVLQGLIFENVCGVAYIRYLSLSWRGAFLSWSMCLVHTHPT